MFLLLTVKILVLAIKCWPFESGIIWRILVVEYLMERANSPSCLNLPLIWRSSLATSISQHQREPGLPQPRSVTNFLGLSLRHVSEMRSPRRHQIESCGLLGYQFLWRFPTVKGRDGLARPSWAGLILPETTRPIESQSPPTRALDCLACSAGQVEESSVDRTSSRMGRGKCC